MKKFIMFLLLLSLFGCNKEKEQKVVLTTNIDLNKTKLEYYEDINLYNLIKIENGTILTEDYQIDTKTLGEKEISLKYKDINNKELDYNFTITIDDTTPPLIFASKKYASEKGEKFNLLDKVVCGDNYDREMKCEIEGEYKREIYIIYRIFR